MGLQEVFMKKILSVAFLVCVFTASGLTAAKERAWQVGLLTDVIDHSSTTRITPPDILTGDREVRNTLNYEYTILTTERFYVARYVPGLKWGGLSPVRKSPIDLDINSKITFSVEKHILYLKDKEGKEYKLGIVKQGLRQLDGLKP